MTDNQKIKDVARDIRLSFRSRMDGVVSHNMREKGVAYHINWGISLKHLQELAADYTPDFNVALELWKDDVRESKIMALMLMPPSDFSADIADLWIDMITTQEMAEMAAMLLYDKLSYAPELAYRLISQSDSLKQILGYNILSRLITNDNLPDARGISELADQISVAIHDKNISVRHAAHNCLMKLSLCDKLSDSPFWHALCHNII